jgi:N-hydroxyarylamine O-acetyltransferase
MPVNHLSKERIKAYLGRIGLNEEINADLSSLKKIHRQHLLTIPFENLDIHYNREISLNIDSLYRKIVLNRRGGFCYELNTLFYALLISLGYKAKIISAQVFEDEKSGPEFDHMAVLLELEGKEWLCDVGFGDSFIEPLEFAVNKEQKENYKTFSIQPAGEERYNLAVKKEGGEFRNEYMFTTQERTTAEFYLMCRYHQTSPESHFTQKKVCTLATENGRITLRDNRLIITEGLQKKEIPFTGEDIFLRYLDKYFGIKLNS